jgi:hypothetical protein
MAHKTRLFQKNVNEMIRAFPIIIAVQCGILYKKGFCTLDKLLKEACYKIDQHGPSWK